MADHEEDNCPKQVKHLQDTNDPVDHPRHYTSNPSGVECIDVVEHMTFNRGAAVKYIWRAGLKGGKEKEVQDLKKAIWFLQREVERISK